MKISCQSCQSKYNVADEKVQGKIVKIRCRKCGATIVVNGTAGATTNGSVVPEPPQPAAAADGGEQWHVNVNENDQRSMAMAELVEAYNAGAITQETFIWTDGMDDWKPLSDVDAVVAALHAHADQANAAGQGQIYAASVVPAYEPEPEPAPAPAARTYEAPAPPPSYGSSYGAQAQAVVPASEPRRAAVVKREARARDLFGGAGGDDVQTSAPSMPHATSREADDAASKLTGERNENSVLFSLAVLTQAGDERPAHEAPSPTQKDDSGLIDLKALAARTESMRPVAPKADGDVFAPPLGFTPPVLGSPIGALGGGHGDVGACRADDGGANALRHRGGVRNGLGGTVGSGRGKAQGRRWWGRWIPSGGGRRWRRQTGWTRRGAGRSCSSRSPCARCGAPEEERLRMQRRPDVPDEVLDALKRL